MQFLTSILFVLSLGLLVVTVYSLAVDIWLSELKISLHNRDEIFSKLGLWLTCLTHDICIESADALRHELKALTQKKSGWMFMVQLLVTLGSISLGYSNIVILRRIVNFGGHGLKFYYIFTTTFIMFYASALLLFGLSCIRYFGVENFRWGISIKLSMLATVIQTLALVMVGVWHAKRRFLNDRKKDDRQLMIEKHERFLPCKMMESTNELSMYWFVISRSCFIEKTVYYMEL